ncbi:hypothetical protein [Anaplasma bovis]|uniref:hypothetical protein n=1 Tax=Anaplasma bovis TaxID=186733 RepID=UPI002FEFF80F
MKHSLADSSVELGPEGFPDNQGSNAAGHARTDISKSYHSPFASSTAQSAPCDAALSDTEEIAAYQLSSSLVGRTHKGIESGCADRRTRENVGQDAGVQAPDSKTVVSTLYVSLSDQARVVGMMSSHSVSSSVLSNNGVSDMDKSHRNDDISRPYHSSSLPEARTYRGKRYILARVMHKKGKVPTVYEIPARVRNLYENEVAGTIVSSGSEAVSLTAIRTSLSREFPEGDNVVGGMVSPPPSFSAMCHLIMV